MRTIDKTAGAMEALRRALHALDTAHLGEKARADACRAARARMAALREAADELEELVPQTYWPMPDYCELLFDLVRPAAHGFCVQKSYCKRKTALFRAAASRGTGLFLFRRVPGSTRRSAKPQPPPGIFRNPIFRKSPSCLRPQ